VLVPPIAASAGPPDGRTLSRIPIRVRFAETDLMGIVHHANYLLYFEEARVEYLARRGAVYREWVAQGIHFPLVDERVRYRQPAFFHDALSIETWIGEYSRVTFRFDFRVFRGEEVLAEAYTTVACVDNARAPKKIPAHILELVLGPERA
jgi:acyl-CoA thioester hydrolase